MTGKEFNLIVHSRIYRISAMERPELIVQSDYNVLPWFWRCFNNKQMFPSGVEVLLLDLGDQISA
jgi:hypothetical protein